MPIAQLASERREGQRDMGSGERRARACGASARAIGGGPPEAAPARAVLVGLDRLALAGRPKRRS